MSSTFAGIEIGKRALQAQQKSIDVTGHNIANANNEDYSRQRAIQSATDPHPYPALHNSTGAGQVGTGVEISRLERVRDKFVDMRLRDENHNLGKWSMIKEKMKDVEGILNELNQGGLTNSMDEVWKSFQELNNNPESLSVRETVVQKSITLTKQFNHFNQEMKALREDLGLEIEQRVDKINDYTKRIADLNQQIKAIETDTSKQANDLMDKRDALLDKLSKLTDMKYTTDKTNQVNISLNGINIVWGKFQKNVSFSKDSVSKTSSDGVTYSNISKYRFKVGDNEAKIKSGEIKGLMEARTKIQDYKMNKLDRVARELISQVNNQHDNGYGLKDNTNRNFFSGSDASDISVTNTIKNNPGHIAAAKSWADANGDGTNDYAGDGSNALDIAQLKDTGTIDGSDFNDFWQTQSSKLGTSITRAERMETNQQVLVDNMKQKREEKSGVSLDEEMSNMIKFQHGYQAAAKVMSQMDQMFRTLNGIIR